MSGKNLFMMRCLVAALATILASYNSQAQVLYGSLTGTVSDPSGAAVPGANVEALDVGTGVAQKTTTNNDGIYLFSNLQPGTYRITISSPAFANTVLEGAAVTANQVRRADATLQVAQTNQTVEVSAASPPLQTDRADVNTNITSKQLSSLPITGSNGRNFQSLMTIVPGTSMQGEQNSAAANPQRAISFNQNGVSRLQNNTRIDGSSVTYPWLPTNIAYVPPAEAIETVNVVTNAYNAEQGLAGGAAVNVIIKTGTNDFHGTGWIFNTDSHFFAQNFFHPTPQNNKFILNQFGLNLGGPVWIPKVFNGRNRLFFFVNWERTTVRQGSPPKFLTIPTAALRSGDFSATGTTIYDPASNPNPALRTAFPGNIIPSTRIDPAAATMASLLPQTNVAGAVNNYVPTGKSTTDRDSIDIKVNEHVTDKLAYFGRYSRAPSTIIDPPQLGAAGGDALNGGQLGTAFGLVQIGGAGVTYTITPTLLLDVNAGYTRQRLGAEAPDIGTNYGLDVLHIPGTNGPNPLQGGIPFFAITGWANLGNSNTGSPFLFRDNQYVANSNLSWVKGTHTMRTGFEFQDQQLNHFQAQGGTFQTVRGSFQFNGQAAALQNGPSANMYNSWAAFLLGLPSAAGKVTQRVNPNSLRMFAYAGYVQDQWQVNPKLTVNYGVRWELYPWPHTDQGGVPRFDPSNGNVYIGGVGSVPVDTYATAGYGQFLPRIGIAYRVTENTVIRSGFGLSADPRPFIDFRNAYPNINAWAMPVPSNTFVPVTTLRAGLNEAAYGQFPSLDDGVIKLPANTGTTTWPKDVRRKYIESWNFMVQHEFGGNITAQAGYVGTRSVGQMQFMNINAGPPATGVSGAPAGNAVRPLAGTLGLLADITEIEPFKTTTYDSLQSQISRRWGTSLIGAVYTWSKAINWADNDSNPRIQWPGAWNLNRGPASYDHTHNFQTYFSLESPFGKGRRWAHSGFASILLGGWSLNGILSAVSGAPFYVVQGTGNNLNAAGSLQVPDLVKSSVAIYGGVGLRNPYFDTSAYAPVNIPANQPQRFGNSGRNNIRGPGFLNLDSGLFRDFAVRERFTIQFRAEALNVLNHPNFQNPNSDITSGVASFGFVTATVANLPAPNSARQFRFATRIFF